MKAWLQKKLEQILANLARRIIYKYQPEVIGITGSVGKTSAKDAIACVLGQRFSIRVSSGNYNNDLGVPLAIIGGETHGRNPFGWLGEIWRGNKLLFWKGTYPNIVILEMGADKTGDIERLMAIAQPRIGVLTAIAPAHLELFGSIEAVVAEKAKIITHLPSGGFSIRNADDERVMGISVPDDVISTTYGLTAGAEVRATGVAVKVGRVPQPDGIIRENVLGTACIIHYEDLKQPLLLKNLIGPQHVMAALAATAVGIAYGLTLADIAARLEHYQGPPGRMRLITGRNRSLLIDDSYNSSPDAAVAALDALKLFPKAKRRVAVLGTMAELGDYAQEAHERVGAQAGRVADLLVAVGPFAATYAEAARKAKLQDDAIITVADAEAAANWLHDEIRPGDAFLIKGSQISRLERVTKKLMAEPLRAGELLVRQSEEWLTKP